MDRIEKVDKLILQIAEMLPCIYDSKDDEIKRTHFFTDPDRTGILSTEESEIETLANLFDQLYGEGTCTTGWYEPDVDKMNSEVDAYTILYYLTIS